MNKRKPKAGSTIDVSRAMELARAEGSLLEVFGHWVTESVARRKLRECKRAHGARAFAWVVRDETAFIVLYFPRKGRSKVASVCALRAVGGDVMDGIPKQQGTWVTKEYRRMKIHTMTTGHIINTIRYFLRQAVERGDRPRGGIGSGHRTPPRTLERVS